ncbi:MAG: transcription termination/antitermination protein NusA [Armatimonadetes bacterium]|nr:transcription termination/antitermination protein NusA [Armatimonadota bacterium]
MNGEFLEALEQLQKEKDIPMAALLQTVEAAMASAYRKHYGSSEDVRLLVDPAARTVKLLVRKPILPEVPEGEEMPSLEELEELGLLKYEERELDTAEFGRIAAQTAKQVVMQRIREAEREIVYDEFSHRVGEVVTAEVQRKDARNVFLALGRAEALLPAHEQIPGEPYRFNDRLKVYILEVRKTTKTPQIVVSRTHPALVTRLFELEVPEVFDGIVEIKSVAREPGARSKVAVLSKDPQIDAVGACVGHRGARVQAIVDELRGEKIDIVRYNADIVEYLKSALSPARVSTVLPNPADQSALVIAPDSQLSLAIGRRGQNVRLAAQLTGWRIDIRSESQWAEQPEVLPAAAAQAPIPEEAPAAPAKRLRIYELAKELEVESKDLVEILQEEGIEVTSHSSTVSEEVATMLRELLSGGEGTLDELEAGELAVDE